MLFLGPSFIKQGENKCICLIVCAEITFLEQLFGMIDNGSDFFFFNLQRSWFSLKRISKSQSIHINFKDCFAPTDFMSKSLAFLQLKENTHGKARTYGTYWNGRFCGTRKNLRRLQRSSAARVPFRGVFGLRADASLRRRGSLCC